jgi:pimeloyl-ACP methyl ester carboxylesterase
MGGGASLYYALKGISYLKALILCGSSGLSTIPMQKGFFQRKNYSFVKKATQEVFFDPSIPTDDMIKEVFDAIQDYEVVLRSIRFTKSTAKDQLHSRLSEIKIPVLLIWGKQDKITPPETGLLFRGLLPNAELYFVNSCGHVPTQEQPKEAFELIQQFLQKIEYT